MQKVLVYNPATTPAVYGDGQIVGGQEWLDVDISHLQELLDAGCIYIPEEGEPVVEPMPDLVDHEAMAVEAVEEVAEEAVEAPVEDTAEEVASEEPATPDETDTISKPRRRKSQSADKE